MRPLRKHPRPSSPAQGAVEAIGGPLVWTFDGPFATCLADMEDALRPGLKRRVDAGDAIQPEWGQFLERMSDRYGLPARPRVRPLGIEGPLATLVIAYRS